MAQQIWIVERGEYEQTYVAAAFTSEAQAKLYVADRGADCYVSNCLLHDVVAEQVPYWHFGASVFPNGEVERWNKEGKSDEAMEPVDNADRLFPWDGHTQGHCGFHVSVFGSDREKTEAAREKWIGRYQPHCTGTCQTCGRTERYVRDRHHVSSRPVEVKTT